jgi:hypothetical protein
MAFGILYLPTPSVLVPLLPKELHINFSRWPYRQAMDGSASELVRTTCHNAAAGLYLSVVTFVTLGYGDITPTNTFGMIVCPIEALLGYLMLGLFIAVMSSRLRPG